MRPVRKFPTRRIGGWAAFVAIALFARAAVRGAPAFADPNAWQWAPSRAYHVENYRLKLHFDEPKAEVFGDEVMTLRPFEDHFRKFYLDSSELQVDSVMLDPPRGAPVKLAFATQDARLWITLDRDYPARTMLNVRIVYRGFPRTGLFFVNPTLRYPKWPQEVFSQGEPELNHYWFPCWDYPNDMATSETITTVPEGQSVVSNGKLVKVTRSAAGVTYDWVEKVPHSSYLISIAAGPWRKVSDRYDGKPVDYYVARSVDETTARRSFHLTPDMLAFFSRATGVEYPYEQYAQTTVHNYIFGGQENVSATTLTDSTLHDERAEKDYPSTALVAHELGQQWFGDYVQGRDWADIWMNEGFATYMEALYTQHHEGEDAFRLEMYNDQLTSQAEDRDGRIRPIVYRHYTDPMDMFDAITHEKGACALDMLRYVIDGPEEASRPASQSEPLFQALHHYLVTRHAQTADTSDLVRSIRETTGRELNWFFREWVYMAGTPEYHVEASYDAKEKVERVSVAQKQQGDGVPSFFQMPIELAFNGPNGERKETRVFNNSREQEFDVPLDFDPQWVDFDPDDFVDKSLSFEQPVHSLVAEAEKDPAMMSRLTAVRQLGAIQKADEGLRVVALAHVLDRDKFYAVRAAAAAGLGNTATDQAKTALLAALQQPDSRVRAAAVESLGHFASDTAVYNALVKSLHTDASYAVEAAAAQALGNSGAPRASEVLGAEASSQPEVHVMIGTLDGLASVGDARAAAILVAQAQLGVPERVRLSALRDIAKLKKQVVEEQHKQLVDAVGAALVDPFYPVQSAGGALVGAFGLTQFEGEIANEARDAPMMLQREAAKKVLAELRHGQ
jgi:aminopeptidase N